MSYMCRFQEGFLYYVVDLWASSFHKWVAYRYVHYARSTTVPQYGTVAYNATRTRVRTRAPSLTYSTS